MRTSRQAQPLNPADLEVTLAALTPFEISFLTEIPEATIAGIRAGTMKASPGDNYRFVKLRVRLSAVSPAFFRVWLAKEKYLALGGIMTPAEKTGLLESRDLGVYESRLEELILRHKDAIAARLATRYTIPTPREIMLETRRAARAAKKA